MTSPRYAIQNAVFVRLDADMDATTITDDPDQDTIAPFIDIGQSTIEFGADKTALDYTAILTIRVVTEISGGQGTKAVSELQHEVVQSLTASPLVIGSGYVFNWLTVNRLGDVLASEDGQFYVADIELEIYFQKS